MTTNNLVDIDGVCVYLAHPIDFAHDPYEIGAVANEIRDGLIEAGATAIYTPAQAWDAKAPLHAAIQEINLYALLQCDVAIIYLPEQSHSLGVPFEMGICYGSSKPMVIIRGDNPASSELTRRNSALLAFLRDTAIFSTDQIEAACRWAITTVVFNRMVQNESKDD